MHYTRIRRLRTYLECEAFVDDDNPVSGLFVGLRQRIPMTVLIVVIELITVDYVKESLGV